MNGEVSVLQMIVDAFEEMPDREAEMTMAQFLSEIEDQAGEQAL